MKKNAYNQYLYKMKYSLLLCTMFFLPSKAQEIYTIDKIVDRVMHYSPSYKLYQKQATINRHTYEISIASLLPSVTLSFSGPTYSKTISPVSQPDGSLKYIEVNNLQYNSSLSTSIPIEFSGGQLSFNSNLSMYGNNRDSNSTKSYSVNYYRFSYNQPLDFFSLNRWNRKLTKANRSKAEIDQLESIVELKYDALKLYFELVKGKCCIEQLSHQKESSQKLYEYISEAYKSGRVLGTEVESIALKIINIENQMMTEQENIKKQIDLLNVATNLALKATEANFSCPKILQIIIDTDVALSSLTAKIDTQYEAQLISQERTVSQIKHKRWGNASLSIGVGLSASASNFRHLSRNKMTDYNTSLNLSFPITSLSAQKKEYENSKLNYEKLIIVKEELVTQQKIELNNLIASIDLNNRKYNYLLKQKIILEQEEEIKINLFKSQRIMYNELEEVIDELLSNENSRIQIIANSYLMACQIERMTLVDFVAI